jgi:two-component SAPR family response regulator
MARIAVCEPYPELLVLFERAVSRLGHEAVPCRHEPDLIAADGVDALLIDCDLGGATLHAEELRRVAGDVPIVTCSIYSAGDDVRALDPVAHLVKPFTRVQLDRALMEALGSGQEPRTHSSAA